MNAASAGNIEILQMLLNAGADPRTKQTPGGFTALHWAVKNHKTAVVEELLRCFSESDILDASSSIGHRPLHIAAYEGFSDIVVMLLDAGADPNVVERQFLTPLRAAVHQGHIGVVKNLIEGGAQMDLIGTDGVSLINVARLIEDEELVSYLSSISVRSTS